MVENTIANNEMSLFKSLKERRVPQIAGIYLGTGWGLVQFVEWIVERYGLSPYLPDFSLVILFSLLPSVLIIAYYHGRPGPDNWTNVEKISIPINLLVTIGLLVFLFSGKELGAATKTMVVENEEGKMIERVVAKSAFRKKVVLFNLKNNTNNAELNWLQGGLPLGINIDLMQDPFINQTSSLTGNGRLSTMLKKAGFPEGVNLPISLMQKVTNDLHFEHFLRGEFSIDEKGSYRIKTSLYDSKTGKLVKKNEFITNDLFEVIDDVSISIKSDLGIPSYQTESLRDLPIKELISQDTDANKNFTLGLQQLVVLNNYKAAAEFLEKAIAKDPSFALAHLFLGVQHANENKSKESLASIKLALKYEYKMTDFFRFLAKEIFYIMSGESTKRLKLLKMQTELYPENVDGRNRLAQVYIASNLFHEAIQEYQKIQKLVNQPETYDDDIGFIYVRMNDLTTALSYMKKYANEFPKETTSFNNLAYIYGLIGNDDLVKENYQKALFIEPENLNATLNLANLDIKHGRFDQAIEVFRTALNQFDEPREKVQIINHLSSVSATKGQPKKALEYKLSSLKELEKISPALNIIIQKLVDIGYYVKAGKKEEALAILKNADETLQAPFQDVPSVGYSIYYLELKQPDKAAIQIKRLEDTINSVGSALYGMENMKLRLKALLAEKQENYPLAIESYKEYAAFTPTDTSSSYQIGNAYLLSGDLESAETHLLKYLESKPFAPLTHLALGKLYLKQKEDNKAKHHLSIAKDIWADAESNYQYAIENNQLLNTLTSK